MMDGTDPNAVPGSGLMPRATIYQLEAYRNAAIAAYGEAWDAMQAAHQAAALAAPSGRGGGYEFPEIRPHDSRASGWRNRDLFLADVTKATDRSVWRHLIATTKLDQLMDRTERETFERQLQDDPPPAIASTCIATMERLLGDAGMIFRRGIAVAFARLDRRFRSHDGFKIGSRVVLSYAFNDWGGWARDREDMLWDVERTFLQLDGKPPGDRHGGIIGLIDAERRRRPGLGRHAYEVEGAYFRVVCYKNGNAHLWFTRKDLVQKVNLMLAEYYGENLGAGPDEADVKHRAAQTPATSGPGGFGLFPSPEPVVREIMRKAGLLRREDVSRPDDREVTPTRILEPSAGPGAIAAWAAQTMGAKVTCVEIQPHLAAALSLSGQYERVVSDDFLNRSPADLGLFDAIVMNPPFDQGRDIDHVTHALDFLAPGGVLISVMGAGVEFREDRKTVDFRAEVERRGGRFFDLPEGSFRESGTNMNTVLCCIGRRHWS